MSTVSPYLRQDGRWAATLSVDGVRKTVYGKSEREVRQKVTAIVGQVARSVSACSASGS